MPLYTFKCEKCGEIVRYTQGFFDVRPTKCEVPKFDKNGKVTLCGGKLIRQYDSPNVVYRGSGFYHTDKVLSDPIKPEDMDD